MKKYGIIGFGGLGKKHFCNLLKIESERKDISLAAIAGTTKENAQKSVSLNIGQVDTSGIDFSKYHFYDDYKDMLDHEKLDFVLSVVPTFLHEEVASEVLRRGIDLFSEKPMALTLEGCEKMIRCAKEKNLKLMIGQCLRFDPSYLKIKKLIDDGIYGKVRRAVFERYSQLPIWTWNNWILDEAQSGGCVLDMHIHDTDLINWFFGMPLQVNSVKTNTVVKGEGIISNYFYGDKLVTAIADWSLPQKYPFTERLRVDFEKATVLLEHDTLCTYTDDGVTEETISAMGDMFYDEMLAFVGWVSDHKACRNTSLESVYDSVRLLFAERESAESGKSIAIK